MNPLKKIISGGQTGADAGALLAGRELGLETGGFAPQGWLTEDGPQEERLRALGLSECDEPGYPARTRRNVVAAEGTLIVGPHRTGGTRLTFDIATELQKPVFRIARTIGSPPIAEFRNWLAVHNIKTLNVAGPRESENPGIAEFTRRALVTLLGEL